MKFAKATKFHRKSGQGLGLNPEAELSAVGAALNLARSHLCHQDRSGLTCSFAY